MADPQKIDLSQYGTVSSVPSVDLSAYGTVTPASGSEPVRGMEKLGGTPPSAAHTQPVAGGASAGTPLGLQPDSRPMGTRGQGNEPGLPLVVSEGLDKLFRRAPEAASNSIPRAGAEALEGAGMSAAPLVIPALVAAPAATVAGGVGSYLAGKAGEGLADYGGSSPDVKRLAGDIGSVVGGGAGGFVGESPKIRAFTGGALKTVPPKLPVMLGSGGIGFGAHLPPWITAAGELGYALPGMIRGGAESATGKPWAGPIAQSLMDRFAPPQVPTPRMIEAPADSSFVRGYNAQYGEQPLLTSGSIKTPPPQTPDTSFVRGVPAMTQPPNPARALPAGPRVISLGPVSMDHDSSFVRGVPAKFANIEARSNELAGGAPIIKGTPSASPNVAPPPVAPNSAPNAPAPDYSPITKQYTSQPSRSSGKFGPNGERLGPDGKPMFPNLKPAANDPRRGSFSLRPSVTEGNLTPEAEDSAASLRSAWGNRPVAPPPINPNELPLTPEHQAEYRGIRDRIAQIKASR